MPRPTSPLTPLHLRKLLLRCFSSSVTTQTSSIHPSFSVPRPSPPRLHRPFSFSNNASTTTRRLRSLPCPFFSNFRFFSSQTEDPTEENPILGGLYDNEKNPFLDDLNDEESTAQILSSELLKDPDLESLSLPQRLDLSFSHINLEPSLILKTLNHSPDAGRTVLDFLKWVNSRPNFTVSDQIFSYFVDYFGRRKDFKAAHDVLVDGIGKTSSKCFESLVDRLVRAGRPTEAVALFEKMGKEYGFVRNLGCI